MRKLNIGCGNVPLVGYTNIDKYYYPDSPAPLNDNELAKTWNQDSPWFRGDAVELDFDDEEFDKVLMVHTLEHLTMEAGTQAIKEAYRVCKTGGTIEIEVPDLLKACELMLKTPIENPIWYRIWGCIYGTTGMDGEGQFHMCGYTKDYLKMKLEEGGFKNIEEIPVGFGHGNSEDGHPEPEYDFRLRATK